MKTQYYTASSLDGFIATEDDSLEWLFPLGDVNDTSYPAFIAEVGALAMGSATYEWMLRHALTVMQRHRDSFRWLAETPKDFLTRPGGWPETRYEAKARNVYGHEVWYFRYRRL